MKKGMHKDYAALCNLSTVDGTSEYLFGGFSKLAKDITEANKLTKKVCPQYSVNSRGDKYAGCSTHGSSHRRFQPYPRGKSWDFLGKSRFSKPPRKKGRRNQPVPKRVSEVCDGNITSLSIDIVHCLVKSQTSFQAGELIYYLPQWEAITTDPTILQIVTGVRIEFKNSVAPTQHYGRRRVFHNYQHSILKLISFSLMGSLFRRHRRRTNLFLQYFFG